MRQSDYACAGPCEIHGSWSIQVTQISYNSIVPDTCPMCMISDLESGAESEGYKSGYEEGLVEGKADADADAEEPKTKQTTNDIGDAS